MGRGRVVAGYICGCCDLLVTLSYIIFLVCTADVTMIAAS